MAAGAPISELAQHGQSQPALPELPCRHPELCLSSRGIVGSQSTAAREAIALFCPPHGRYIHHPTAPRATQPRPEPVQTIGPTPAIHNRHDFGRAERAGRRARTGQRTIPCRPPLARCFAVNASLPLYTAYPPCPPASPSAIHSR